MGNVIYYACAASAIQRTGAPVIVKDIATVVIPLFANILYSQRDGVITALAPAGAYRFWPAVRQYC